MYMYMYVNVNVYVYVYVCVCRYMCMQACVGVYECMFILLV